MLLILGANKRKEVIVMDPIVIIPALDPDEKLQDIVRVLHDEGVLVVLVDDGSASAAQAVFAALEEDCVVLHHTHNQGKGAAIKTALRYIQHEFWEVDVIGIMDADGQHRPEDMLRVLQAARSHPHALVLGSRSIDANVPWKSRFGNLITRRVFQLITGVQVNDTQTGLRAFSAEQLSLMLSARGERYEYEMNVLVLCARHGVSIIEVPIETIYHDKNNSCSHFRRVRDSVRIYKELLTFSMVSFSSFLVDYVLFALFLLFVPAGALWVAAANVAARLASGCYNYLMNCRFVFHARPAAATALNYLALAGGILLLNSVFLQGYMAVGLSSYVAKIATECTLFVISWVVQKRVIFRRGGSALRAKCAQEGDRL